MSLDTSLGGGQTGNLSLLNRGFYAHHVFAVAKKSALRAQLVNYVRT